MIADQITRTAEQVRTGDPRSAAHTVVEAWFARPAGHHYRTACGRVLVAVEGAHRTTRKVSCESCLRGVEAP